MPSYGPCNQGQGGAALSPSNSLRRPLESDGMMRRWPFLVASSTDFTEVFLQFVRRLGSLSSLGSSRLRAKELTSLGNVMLAWMKLWKQP